MALALLYFSYKEMVLDPLDLLYILSGNRSQTMLCINWWLILESETKRLMRITYYNRLSFHLAINSTILCLYDLYGVDFRRIY